MNDVGRVPVLLSLAGNVSQVIGDSQDANRQRQKATNGRRAL